MRSLKMLSIALYRFDSKINLWGIKWLEAYPTGLCQLHEAPTVLSEFYCTANNPPPAQYASYPTAIC